MADTYLNLRLSTPCTPDQLTAWTEEMNRVIAGHPDAVVSTVTNENGTGQIVVDQQDEV